MTIRAKDHIIKIKFCHGKGVPKSPTLYSTTKNCRYNVNGFVEELPKLPEKITEHACAALPDTGVRPTQPGSPTPLLVPSQEGRRTRLVTRRTQLTFTRRHLLWPVETMDPLQFLRW